jgi:cation diffusion facilitator family transporter
MAGDSKKVIYAALIGNAAIAVTKFGASVFTGSSAMLSEAIHSVVDTGNQVLLLWGIRKAKRPPDENFPYGYGKEIYFWSFVVAIMIFAVGAGVAIYEGIKHLQHPREMTNPMVNYVVLALAMLFEGAAWGFAWFGFRKTKGDMGYLEAVRHGKDPTLFVVLFEDSAAMAGLMVAMVGIALVQITGIPYFDGLASVIIGLILATVAGWLAWETHGLLIGEAASRTVREEIRKIVTAQPGIKHLNELLTMHVGPEAILVTLSVDFKDGLPSEDVETAVAELNREIHERIPEVSRVFIETESYRAHQRQIEASRES